MNDRLLITDLDNTLYDWVTFFALAFDAMVEALVPLLDIDRYQILAEFKTVHQTLGSSEHPYAVFELPSVKTQFPDASPKELADYLDEPLHRFNSVRKAELRLYPGVAETLAELARRGVVLVGHTEAAAVNAYYRIHKLGISQHFRHLYVLEGPPVRHPEPERQRELEPPDNVLRVVPPAERKPNPRLLADICTTEGVALSDAVYVGDSLGRDVYMAKLAGVTAVWARYGTAYEPERWRTLVQVTHWTQEDVAREARIRESTRGVTPDYTIDAFSELTAILGAGSVALR
jgi:FMN phosphatase YigB (HAD superfamily)